MTSKETTKSQIRAKIRWGIIGIFALFVFALAFNMPTSVNRGINAINGTVGLGLPTIPEKGFSLGLDLQGGASLIYEADVSALEGNEKEVGVEGARDIIERRVNGLGVGEPEVRTTKVADTYRINVELPGVSDVNAAIEMIGGTPILEFKEENTEPARELTEEEREELDSYNAEAKKRAEEALSKVKENADSFADTAVAYSVDEQSKANGGYVGYVVSASNPELHAWASGVEEGYLSEEVVETFEGFNVLKRGAERDGQEMASASHILICYLGAEGCDAAIYTKDEAKKKANEIFQEVNADNFADLAQEHSTDVMSKDNGGELGTFPKGYMIPELEDAVFQSEVNQIVGPVETSFGFHIVYKTGQSFEKEYEVSRILVDTKTEYDFIPPEDQWKGTGLSGKQLDRAEVVSDPNSGAIQVSLQFDGEGKDLFADLTERHVGDPIAIFLDGAPISVPVVQTAIRDGRAVISGSFNIKEAQLLAQRLNAGALPVPVSLVSQQSIGASLGAESLYSSLKAGIIALIIVMMFMLIYYRLPGVLAVISLIIYIAFTLALFKIIGVTLTLAGIAGFILSIGMAVDANVLIFERLKEELKEGKSLKAAVEEGYLRAWTSIRDGNVSTLITCGLLISFGSSFVQGFAVTLGLGVLISMFTAIVITRMMLRFIVPWFKRKGNALFLGFTPEKESKK